MTRLAMFIGMLLAGCLLAPVLQAETGYDAWLRYAPLANPGSGQARAAVPAAVSIAGGSIIL